MAAILNNTNSVQVRFAVSVKVLFLGNPHE